MWLLLGAFTGERRETISVNEWGRITTTKTPLSAGRIALIVLAGIWFALQLFVFITFVGAMGSDTSTTSMGLLI